MWPLSILFRLYKLRPNYSWAAVGFIHPNTFYPKNVKHTHAPSYSVPHTDTYNHETMRPGTPMMPLLHRSAHFFNFTYTLSLPLAHYTVKQKLIQTPDIIFYMFY